jgi:hypothetical protein
VTLFTSTLTASLWIVFIIVSASFVKMIAYLNYPLAVIRWLFDIDKHPFGVIGKVAAIAFVIVFMVLGVILRH